MLIPAFNEGQVIGDVIAEVRRNCDWPIYVIDDASSDDTVARARAAGAVVIPHCTRLGAWGAIQTGMRKAMSNNFEIAITLDADGQHDVSSLDRLIYPVISEEADVAIGACTSRGSLARKFTWVLMKKVSGLTLEDITSGFRVYNRSAMAELSSSRATLLDYQDVGVLLLLQSKGFRICDVEVAMRPRQHGKSRVFSSWPVVFYYMVQTLLLGFSKRKLSQTYRTRAAASS